MKITLTEFNERIPIYDTGEEKRRATAAYLAGDYSQLTCDEIAFFRDCEEDPDNRRWEREHAGQLLRITQEEVDGELFIHRPSSESLEKSRQWLKEAIGPHPITPLNTYLAF